MILGLYSALSNTELFQILKCLRYEMIKVLNDQLTKECLCVISTISGQAVCKTYKCRENLRPKSSTVTLKQTEYREEGPAMY